MDVIRRAVVLLGLLLASVPAWAQVPTAPTATASLTTSTCPGTGCVQLNVSGYGSASVQLTGSWSGTVTFEVSTDGVNFVSVLLNPSTSTTPVSTTTSSGLWLGSVGGAKYLRARFSTASSGTVVVTLQASPAGSARNSGGGGGGGSGTVTEVDTTNPLSGGPLTTSGALSCPTCTTNAASLTSNAVVIGGGSQAAATISGDSTTTHALFATAGAPAFRALLGSDVPTLNQNTTGSAAKWTTARLLGGNSTDGSANVPFANLFLVQGTADSGLTGAQFMGALGTGIVKNTTTTGVQSIAVSGDFPTLNQNTSGTAANLSGTPALPNGTTATTQSAGDSSGKLATDNFVTTAVNNAIAGVNPAVAVQAATAAVLQDTPTYNNGASGIGAFITAGVTNTTLVVDGYTPSVGDRLLIKAQGSAFQNGIYTMTTLGSLAVAWVITRALDYDQPSDMNNTGAIPVVNGTVNAQTSWVQTSTVTTVGTDAVTFTQFSLNPTTLVVGPGSATDGVPVLFDGTTGKLVKNSTPTGTGNPVRATSPALVTPNLGTPSAINLSNATNFPATIVQTGQSNTYSTGAQDFTSATSEIVPTSAGYAPTANGSIGFNSTQNCWSLGGAGAVNGCGPRVLYVTNSTTDTLTAATINTTETQFASTWQIPANYLGANKILRITYLMQGVATATVPTSLFKIRLGSVGIGGTTVYTQTALALATGAARVDAISFIIQGTAAAGAAANVVTSPIGVWFNFSIIAVNTTSQPVAIATNAAQNINLTMTFGGNAASNTWTVLGMIVEELN